MQTQMTEGGNGNRPTHGFHARPVLYRALRLLRTRKRLPFWRMLLIWLIMSIGFMTYNWYLVRQDESIAPREQVALGNMYKRNHGRTESACYSFSYGGKEYHKCETVSSVQCFCDVAVFFDPTNPSLSSIKEYRLKSAFDHKIMVGCGYASVGLAVILAFVLLRKNS
jgi:hypothetical protein